MRNFKKLGVLAIAVLALSAIGAASASAAAFTASTTGSLTGKALENQVFTINGGTISCANAASSGTISELAGTRQHMSITFTACTAVGFATVDITIFTLELTSNGGLHIDNWLKVTPTFFGASMCTITFVEQTVGTVDYANAGTSNVKITPTVTGLKYTSTGGSCGSSGENGTYTGASELSSSGNTLRFDA